MSNLKLVVATRNKGKVKEIMKYLEGAVCGQPFSAVLSLDDVGLDIDLEPFEDGNTFEENATKKAVAVYNALAYDGDKYAVLADDSGLCIDGMGGAPGVDSANYMGRETPYPLRFDAIFENIDGKPRTARFVCVVAFVTNGVTQTFCGEMDGEIAKAPSGEGGFGYDPIFYVSEHGKTAAQLTMEEKNAISHRGRALKKLMNYLMDN